MERRTLTQSDKEEIGLKCCNCGSEEDLQYHHIIPIAIGGQDINSNMCCLCYKCHQLIHFGKSKSINHNELVKQGQAKAREEGILLGRIANKIKVVMNDGTVIIDTTRNISDILNVNLRTVEYWLKNGISEKTKAKRNIKDICYEEINHNGTYIN